MKISLVEKKKTQIKSGDVIIAKLPPGEKVHLQIIKEAGVSDFRLVDLMQSVMWGVSKEDPFDMLSFLKNHRYEILEVVPFEELILTRKANGQ